MQSLEISIIGLGRLGTSLLNLFDDDGYTIKSVFTRNKKQLKKAHKDYSVVYSSSFPHKGDELGDIIFITVSDDAIQSISNQLAQLQYHAPHKLFIHCSGIHSATILSSLSNIGHHVGAFHFIQTFDYYSSVDIFRHCYATFEGDKQAETMMKVLSKKWQVNGLFFDTPTRQSIHALASMMCYFLSLFFDSATQLVHYDKLKSPPLHTIYKPLMKQVMKKFDKYAPHDALTGPVVRVDNRTIHKHLELFQKTPIEELYKILTVLSAEMLHRNQKIDKKQMNSIISSLMMTS